MHGSGFLAVYLAGMVVGNRPTRAHNTVVVFLDAVTWLAQIVMFVLLGLLAWPHRLVEKFWPALAVAVVLMLVARPLAVFLCLAPFRFPWREKIFIAWVGLRGAVGIFLASIPLLVGIPNAATLFRRRLRRGPDFASGAGLDAGAGRALLHVALPRTDRAIRRVELDLPGQLEQELVGYGVRSNSLYLRRGVLPSWSKPTLIVRSEKVLSPAEAEPVQTGDYIYLLAPPEKAQALDRFFADMPATPPPDPRLLGDFFLSGEETLGQLAEIYGVPVPEGQADDDAVGLFRHPSRPRAQIGCDAAARRDRAGGARHRRRSGQCRGLAPAGDEDEEITPPTRKQAFRRKLAEIWSQVAGV